ncbi:putative mitochondrial protein AtMg00310 [Apium graveolens]|uniref:putative mitochondrial protein AtMg00310 n=1 Tax=Apium graveolens TaxID=4045 RepID=UPI003D7ABCB4
MLAKQGWRILTEAHSLVSKLMRACYFPDTDFLNAKLGVNPSYLWRSILSAQDAIKVGCRRRIGDGTSTKVWNVPWLPCEENGCVSTDLVPELQNINVQNLMDIDTNTWDNDVLDDLFNDRDR